MTEQEFKRRTKNIALRIIKLIESLPKTLANDVISKQLLRAGTSIGANYRAACRGKSTEDLLHKLAIVEEEADETLYWLELLGDSGRASLEDLRSLADEANQILAMTIASKRTLKRKMNAPSFQ